MFNKIKSWFSFLFIEDDDINYYHEKAQQAKDKLNQEASMIAEHNYLIYYDYVLLQIDKACEKGKFEKTILYGDLFQEGALKYSYDKLSLAENKIMMIIIEALEEKGLQVRIYYDTFAISW